MVIFFFVIIRSNVLLFGDENGRYFRENFIFFPKVAFLGFIILCFLRVNGFDLLKLLS